MSYFAVDDEFFACRKVVLCASNTPIGLWARAGSWCQKYLTDGFVPAGIVAALNASDADAAELCRVELWLPVPGGYQFVNWAAHNGTRATILARREADVARKQRGGRADSARIPAGRRTASTRPTPTPTPTDEDLYLSPLRQALTPSARGHNGGGDKSREAYAWLNAILMAVVAQPAPRVEGKWNTSYKFIGVMPAREWLLVEACLRSELSSGRLPARQCTPGHVADYWRDYANGEPPGPGNGRPRKGPSVVGTQAEHDADAQHEEPMP